MSKIIDIEKLREDLIQQKKEIDEKLRALSIVENMTDSQSTCIKNNLIKQDDFNEMSMVDACHKIFIDNPYQEFLIKEVLDKLIKEGVKFTEKNKYSSISSTLNRLVIKKGVLQKRLSKNKALFKLKSAPSVG